MVTSVTQSNYKSAVKKLRELLPDFRANLRKKPDKAELQRVQKAFNRVKPDSVHVRRWEQIKSFVAFRPNFSNLTAYQKSKIKKYYDGISKIAARKNVVYRGRNPQRLKTAQEYSGTRSTLPQLSVAFIPYDTPSRPTLKFSANNKIIELSSNEAFTTIIPFDDQIRLATDTTRYVRELVAPYPKTARFRIQSGFYLIPGSRDKDTIAEKVEELVQDYNATYDGWLTGLVVLLFKGQKSTSEFRKEVAKKRRVAKKKTVDKKRAKRVRVKKIKI